MDSISECPEKLKKPHTPVLRRSVLVYIVSIFYEKLCNRQKWGDNRRETVVLQLREPPDIL